MGKANEFTPMRYTQHTCFICGNNLLFRSSLKYKKCNYCKHEVLNSGQEQTFALNEDLNVKTSKKLSYLERYKIDTLKKIIFHDRVNRCRLIDLGSSTGSFLAQNSNIFADVKGVEVMKEAANFARKKYNLHIVSKINELDGPFQYVTAWHVLEHMPIDSLKNTFAFLRDNLEPKGRILLSVPNAESFQHKVYRTKYAFYDPPNHLHQFSYSSIKLLLETNGFKLIKSFNSGPYNYFGHIQALLNLITNSHNYLYYRFKRKSTLTAPMLTLVNLLMLPLIAPFGLILGMLDSFFPRHTGVITQCFEKN
jgi:2-polyprenyl-3-methyl-5-hydroxy-6-metoxy-1,4-benzoquinol methylase